MNTEPIVAFLPAGLDACALYRMFQPHMHMPHSRFVFSYKKLPIEDFAEAKVAVVQRQCTQGNFMAFKVMKDLGMKIIYDLDDNLWAVPATNPASTTFKAVREGLIVIASRCDLITVSTPSLQTAVRTAMAHSGVTGLRIEVVPNMIDLNWFHQPQVPKDKEKVILGWAGSNTHAGDIGYAWEALPSALAKVPNLYMEFVGMAPPASIANHPRVRQRDWVGVGEFPARFSSWGWDICIAPLEDNRFNRSKSNIKMLESGAVGAVCLVSPVGPYAAFCETDPEMQYLVCYSRLAWETKIVELASDSAVRAHYAQVLRRNVEAQYEVTRHIHIWKDVVSSL
jgi:hypothetical protein